MNLILAVVLFCSGFSNMEERQLCTYDALDCMRREESEWQYIKEDPNLHFYLPSENKSRITGLSNCLLIDVDINKIRKDAKKWRRRK